MPEIIVQRREDLTDKVKLSLNGQIRIIDREKQVKVNESELDILMNSHEAPYIFVIPTKEDINADTSSPVGSDPDLGRNEASPRKNVKFW